MKTYEKPAVVTQGYFPEPVEAGCCLRSCGGAPAGLQAGRQLTKEVTKIFQVLAEATK